MHRTLLCAFFCFAPLAHADDGISWQPWTDDLFARAAKEQRLVLLDLGAVWCHWCHVMDRETYANPEVARLIRERYLPVRVDQDARPDLANRYEDYGWPATIIFKWDGSELAKLRGYIEAPRMIELLDAFAKDPTPGPSVRPEAAPRAADAAALPAALRADLEKRVLDAYDREQRGWGTVHKYLTCDCVEWCLERGRAGDRESERMARETLDAALGLIDPVWGGVYQYSHGGVWTNPHFEKIMSIQAEDLRLYALAFRAWGDARYRKAAEDVRRYLLALLRGPDGAFYVSQDADLVAGEHGGDYFALDDAGRRARGLPRIDTHLYARENGWAVTGLCALARATGDAGPLDDARRAAEWALARRALPDGGFRHDERDAAGPYLADTLAMARGFLALYETTAERAWLARAEAAVKFIDTTFRAPIGFASAKAAHGSAGMPFAPRPQTDENVALARLALRLARLTGGKTYAAIAEHAQRGLAAPDTATALGFYAAGVLLVDRELAREPVHVTVVGAKDDAGARALFAAALGLPGDALVEWLDAREGPLRNPEFAYPVGDHATAYVCGRGTCSPPVAETAELARVVQEMGRR